MQARNKHDLTEREKEILLMVWRGYKYAEIAAILSIAESTVQSHMDMVRVRLNVGNNHEATYIAYCRGIIHPDQVRALETS
jgi:DNA-binding CsgD family transcriptional regulator